MTRSSFSHLSQETRTYSAVAACAIVVYLGALANRFALDDLYIIVTNPIVRDGDAWRALVSPYWPADLGGKVYRPLPVASYTLDWLMASTLWFHAINLAWHAGASVAVTMLAWRWSGRAAAIVAGLIFAVHPVHVEAAANVVGRAELMAGLFAVLAVYAALARGSVGWSAFALAAGVLSKENAAVVPGIIAWGWILGLGRPTRVAALRFVGSWILVGGAYLALRWWVVHPYASLAAIAPVFVGRDALAIRLTAVSALADVVRLLVFPLTLRADYSPNERTIVESVLDGRFVLGATSFLVWAALLAWAWRRGHRVEAFGIGWIGIALLPVANLFFPVGVLVAERTLYLPSVGLALALGALFGRWADGAPTRARARVGVPVLAVLLGAAGVRTALRVPVWRDDVSVAESMLRDSPRSYRGYAMRGGLLLKARRPAEALDDLRTAASIYGGEPAPFIAAADAAFTLRRHRLADSLLEQASIRCSRCGGLYRFQASFARARGDSIAADSLLARAQWIESP